MKVNKIYLITVFAIALAILFTVVLSYTANAVAVGTFNPTVAVTSTNNAGSNPINLESSISTVTTTIYYPPPSNAQISMLSVFDLGQRHDLNVTWAYGEPIFTIKFYRNLTLIQTNTTDLHKATYLFNPSQTGRYVFNATIKDDLGREITTPNLVAQINPAPEAFLNGAPVDDVGLLDKINTSVTGGTSPYGVILDENGQQVLQNGNTRLTSQVYNFTPTSPGVYDFNAVWQDSVGDYARTGILPVRVNQYLYAAEFNGNIYTEVGQHDKLYVNFS
ncbi:MAG: hypothetical protein ABR981_03625, partial [Candidatus Micrarchaeaceae archaeon]